MNTIPQLTAKLVERLLAAYCERICPPHVRHTVELAWRREHDRVTIDELRRICGVPGTRRAVPLAQMRYRAAQNDWLLYYAPDPRRLEESEPGSTSAVRWRRYSRRPSARSLVALLREIDADPQGLFWNRIDGKSLRWCRSDGRCAACETQYCRVLGVEPGQLAAGGRAAAATAQAVAAPLFMPSGRNR